MHDTRHASDTCQAVIIVLEEILSFPKNLKFIQNFNSSRI